jgi:hypothetical protein
MKVNRFLGIMLLLFFFVNIANGQSNKEKHTKNIMDYIEYKKKSSMGSRGYLAQLERIERQMPAKLQKLPERDVAFFDCVMSSISHDKYIDLIDYMLLNPNFRKDIQKHHLKNKVVYSVGKMSELFQNKALVDKFAGHAYRCK